MEQDLISNLPKTILHDILSRLQEEDAARTSVLSKGWAETWSTFPILSFCDTKMIGMFPQLTEDFLRKRRKFIDYVNRTLLRFCDQGLAIKEFKLIINSFDVRYMSRDVDLWLKLVSERGVEKLELRLPYFSKQDEEDQDQCYILPTCVIEAKSLHKLALMGRIRVDQAFLNHSFKFLSLNLRELHLRSLKGTVITDKWFLDLFPKFPFLENLKFDNCTMSETINISSVQLKVLELSNCSNLKEVNIDAPNLLSCGYFGDRASKPVISFLKSSSQLEVNVLIPIYYMDLGNLREFIQNFKPQNVLASLSLFIIPPIVGELNLNVSQVSSRPPSIKHLDLHYVPKSKALYLPLVNSLLSSCCPATISFSLHSSSCCREFIEFFYETLMGRKEDECFCSSSHTKCWWHDLKDVKVSSSTKAGENVDFKTMLDALPTISPREKISFRLQM